MRKPQLIVMSGVPGSGKSSVAEALALHFGFPIFSVDPIESAIIKAGITKSFETGLAAYLVVETLADAQLELGNSLIVDAVNAEEEGKDIWRRLAKKHAVTLTIIELFVGDELVHKQRLEKRVRGLRGFSEVTWEQAMARKRSWTDWKEPVLRLDTAQPHQTNVEKAIR